jgi:hypothetical protein
MMDGNDFRMFDRYLGRIAKALEESNKLTQESLANQREILKLQKKSAEGNDRLSRIMEMEALADAPPTSFKT